LPTTTTKPFINVKTEAKANTAGFEMATPKRRRRRHGNRGSGLDTTTTTATSEKQHPPPAPRLTPLPDNKAPVLVVDTEEFPMLVPSRASEVQVTTIDDRVSVPLSPRRVRNESFCPETPQISPVGTHPMPETVPMPMPVQQQHAPWTTVHVPWTTAPCMLGTLPFTFKEESDGSLDVQVHPGVLQSCRKSNFMHTKYLLGGLCAPGPQQCFACFSTAQAAGNLFDIRPTAACPDYLLCGCRGCTEKFLIREIVFPMRDLARDRTVIIRVPEWGNPFYVSRKTTAML